MFDLTDIEKRNKAGKRLTLDEYIYLLSNNGNALWAFLIHNNTGNINHTLRNILGYTELGFNPDAKAIAKQITMMLQRNEQDEIKTVLSNFQLKENGYPLEFIQKFKQTFNL